MILLNLLFATDLVGILGARAAPMNTTATLAISAPFIVAPPTTTVNAAEVSSTRSLDSVGNTADDTFAITVWDGKYKTGRNEELRMEYRKCRTYLIHVYSSPTLTQLSSQITSAMAGAIPSLLYGFPMASSALSASRLIVTVRMVS
jgi:hypothetical protein